MVGLVQLVLFASHACIHDALVFLWQVGQNVGLESAQDKRGDHALQPMRRVSLAGLYGSGEALGERIHAAQDARHEEVEDAPQLDEAVLDGRARERQASVGLQAFHCLGHLGAGVLDVMGLVEYHAREANVCIRLDIALEQVVGRHEHVMGGRGANHRRPCRLGANHGCGIELWGEADELRHPVVHERRRTHHKRGEGAACLFARENMGDDLQGLSQTHVVGQDAAETETLQRLEPAEAFLLVGAQNPAQRGRHVKIRVSIRVEVTHDLAKRRIALQAHPGGLFEQRVHKQRAVRGQAHAIARHLHRVDAQALGEGVHLAQAVAQLDDVAAGQAHKLLFALVRVEEEHQVARRHAACVHLKVEKTALERRLDAHLWAALRLDGAQALAHHHIAKFSQLR